MKHEERKKRKQCNQTLTGEKAQTGKKKKNEKRNNTIITDKMTEENTIPEPWMEKIIQITEDIKEGKCKYYRKN